MEMRTVNIDRNILEVISIENNIYTHKQIEWRDGKTYMRIKKRVLIGNA